MHMAIILTPSDNYQHQHVVRGTSPTEKTFRDALAMLNPDIHILHTVADVTPEMVQAAVDRIKADDALHDPIHPQDLMVRDAAKVAAEQEAKAAKANPAADDAVKAAREAHEKFKAAQATPRPSVAPPVIQSVTVSPLTPAAHPSPPKPA